MRPEIRIDSYDNFFQQMLFCLVVYSFFKFICFFKIFLDISMLKYSNLPNIPFVKGLNKLDRGFYIRNDVLLIARELLGKILVTNFDGMLTAARIVETEAYAGVVDQASHAFGGRRTNRTEVMYQAGGVAYVYLCYGIHHLFNVVTNVKEVPNAILIRSVEPVYGMDVMLLRTGKKIPDFTLTRGPGNVSKALGISVLHSGLSLLKNPMFIAEDKIPIMTDQIGITQRIGVEYAGNDAKLPYRFIVKNNPYVSGKKVFL